MKAIIEKTDVGIEVNMKPIPLMKRGKVYVFQTSEEALAYVTRMFKKFEEEATPADHDPSSD
jgi:hypothetical protein